MFADNLEIQNEKEQENFDNNEIETFQVYKNKRTVITDHVFLQEVIMYPEKYKDIYIEILGYKVNFLMLRVDQQQDVINQLIKKNLVIEN